MSARGIIAQASTVTAVITVHAAQVQYGKGLRAVNALQAVSFSVVPGERVALVGANGSGKSTLLRLMHGLIRPTTGQAHTDPAARLAMVFQRPYLLRMTVQSNVALGLWLGGLSWHQARTGALRALEGVGLRGLAQRSGRSLSGGEQQRVAMARALALQPQVLLLDEPTASLDPHAKRELEAMMAQFCSQPGPPTMVFASHNLGQVKRLASRVIYLEHGRVLADLPVAEFFEADALRIRYPQAHQFLKGELA